MKVDRPPHEQQLELTLATETRPVETPPAPQSPAPTDMMSELQLDLAKRTGMPIHLMITDNRSTMMSVHHRQDGAHVRLHHMFLAASPGIRAALTHWIKHPRSKKFNYLFRGFIANMSHQIKPGPERVQRDTAQGVCHDLRTLFNEVNDTFFNNTIHAAIGWGRNSRGHLSSIRFGSYCDRTKTIRIHPRLDQPFVPDYMVRYIVYHEMLHAHLGITKGLDGRRAIHTKTFKQLEKGFPEYRQARAWINDKTNLERIMRGAKP